MTTILETSRKISLIEPWYCPDCGQNVLPGTVEDHKGDIYQYPRSFCDCPGGRAKKEEQEKELALAEWSIKGRDLIDQSNINQGKYANFLFETWDKGRKETNAAEVMLSITDYVNQVSDQPRQWLYLCGPYGNGKTHLAVAALRKIALTHMWRPHIIVWPELCQATQESWSSDNGQSEAIMWSKARTTRLLLLDDLDKTATSEWAMSKLFALINRRAVGGLPTIITANKSLSSLKDEWVKSPKTHVRNTGLAVLSRIADELWGGVRFKGKDQRWTRTYF